MRIQNPTLSNNTYNYHYNLTTWKFLMANCVIHEGSRLFLTSFIFLLPLLSFLLVLAVIVAIGITQLNASLGRRALVVVGADVLALLKFCDERLAAGPAL